MQSFRLLLIAAATILLNSIASANTLQLRDNYPDKYVVVKGDTLWDIAGRFLQNPWEWPQIWKGNRDVVEDPHWIYPGEVLYLAFDDNGNPYITNQLPTDYSNVQPHSDLATYKLRPGVKSSDIKDAVPAIPLKSIQSFLTNSNVVNKEDIQQAPYVFFNDEGHIMSSEIVSTYARNKYKQPWSVGQKYDVIRETRDYIDPNNPEKILGTEALYLGRAKITKIKGEVASVNILDSKQEIIEGDRLVPINQAVTQASFLPNAAKTEATVIANFASQNAAAIFDTVILDKGTNSEISPGDVFFIYSAEQGTAVDRIDDERPTLELPQHRKGLVIAFKTFENVSYGLIVESKEPIFNLDRLTPPD